MLDNAYRTLESVQSVELEDETLITQVASEHFYGLDDVSTHIWQSLDGIKTVRQICGELCQTFEVNPEQCQSEVLEFIQSLLDGQLIEAV